MAASGTALQLNSEKHDYFGGSAHPTVEGFPSAEAEELLPLRQYEQRAQRRTRILASLASLAALACAAMMLILIRERRALHLLPMRHSRGETGSDTQLGTSDEDIARQGLHQDSSVAADPSFADRLRNRDTELSDSTLSSERFHDAQEFLPEDVLVASQTGASLSDIILDSNLQQRKLAMAPFLEFSSAAKPLMFIGMPEFPPMSADALKESSVPPLVPVSHYLKRFMTGRIGYGTDTVSQVTALGARKKAIRADFNYFLRALMVSAGTEAADMFVRAALRVEEGGLGVSARVDLADTLWVACASLKNRELLLAQRVRLLENRLKRIMDSQKTLLTADVAREGSADFALPISEKDLPLLPRISSSDLLSMKREVKEILWATLDAHASLEDHYASVAVMLEGLEHSKFQPVLLAAELSYSTSVVHAVQLLQDSQKLGALGAARLATKIPSLMYALRQSENRSSQPWFVLDLLKTVGQVAEQSGKLEHYTRFSLFGKDMEARRQDISQRSIAAVTDNLRRIAEQRALPEWAVAAISFLPF